MFLIVETMRLRMLIGYTGSNPVLTSDQINTMKKLMKTAECLKIMLPAEDFAVCGSVAVSLMGIKCNCKDLDLILVNPKPTTLEILKDLQTKYPVKTKSEYPNENLYRFVYDEVDVDVFISKSPVDSMLTYGESLKVTTLTYIVSEKLKLNRPKDYIQLKKWADQIMSSEKLKDLFNLF